MIKNKEKLTILDLKRKKADKERLAMVAVGEFLSAQWAEAAGIDIIGVGDSLGMTLYGHETPLQGCKKGCTKYILYFSYAIWLLFYKKYGH